MPGRCGHRPLRVSRKIPKNRRGGRPCPPGKLHVQNAKVFGEFGTSLGRTESSAPTQIRAICGNFDTQNKLICDRTCFFVRFCDSMSLSLKTAAVRSSGIASSLLPTTPAASSRTGSSPQLCRYRSAIAVSTPSLVRIKASPRCKDTRMHAGP